MPLPAVVAAAVSVLSAAIVADDLLTGGKYGQAIGKKAAQLVLDSRGIPLDLDGEVNEFTITSALCSLLPDGVVFENVFDKEAVRRDLKQMAVSYAADQFGFDGSVDPDVLRQKIIDEVTREVLADIQAEQGKYLDAAKGLAEVQRLIDRPEPFDWKSPRVFTTKAEKNRDRQAAYRAAHSRKWVEL